MKALFIVTNEKYVWFSEVTHPYWHLIERGAKVDFASPKGGRAIWDPLSDPTTKDSVEPDDLVSKGFLSDKDLVAKLSTTARLSEVDYSAYDTVQVSGGFGAVFDLYPNKDVARALEHFWASGKAIGTICHGSIALANNPDRVRGRHVTGYTREEDRVLEQHLGSSLTLPRFPQPVLEEAGAQFHGVEPFAPCVVVDGKLVTGQNQFSASEYGIALYHAMTGRSAVQTFQ
jgi:putative intracellular protease/amidase